MLKNFVLKSVCVPGKIMMASFEATLISAGVGMVFCCFVNIILGFCLCVLVQGYMIYRTDKDPAFINVFRDGFRCLKTKNYFYVKGNRYDP